MRLGSSGRACMALSDRLHKVQNQYSLPLFVWFIDLQQVLIRLFCLTLCVANHGQTHERTLPTYDEPLA
jgi:hypothetical protein